MTLSIRNQLPGTVASVTRGEAMAKVDIELTGGQGLTAAITVAAVEELGIGPGVKVRALVKATDVALGTAPLPRMSIRNQLHGSVIEVAAGPVLAGVKVAVGDQELTSVITADAAGELGLAAGSAVIALVKATEVALAVD